MPIVFDQITGEVEPDETGEAMEEIPEERETPQQRLRDLRRYLRVMEQREARRNTD